MSHTAHPGHVTRSIAGGRWVALAVLVAIAAGACGNDDSATNDGSDDDPVAGLYGVETVTPSGNIGTLNEDGTWTVRHPDFGPEPFDTGTFVIDGNVIEYSNDAGNVGCLEGQTGVYEFTITDDGEMIHTLIEDGCPSRSDDLTAGPLVPASD